MADQDEEEFEGLIRYIQESRGVDFRGYKRASLRRRTALRMEQTHADGFAGYHAFLEAHPAEFADLLNTVLINVTSFFRDADAWEALRTDVLPQLIEAGRGRDLLRFWSVGCATGEEPYSLAILLAELLGPAEFSRRVKIYATDLDDAALGAARHASYLPRDMEGVPEELRAKYFERSNSHYVVARELRKAVIFGRHNVMHDPPISHIDLLMCRNLLIYLETGTQNAVLPRLHYALVDDGVLFLGKAETQLTRSKLFFAMDTKQRVFRKIPQAWWRPGIGNVMPSPDAATDHQSSLRSRMFHAIAEHVPLAALAIDRNDTLVFANAAARRLLELSERDIGRPFHDLPLAYRPPELRGEIAEVRQSGQPKRTEHQEFQRPPDGPICLSIEIAPLFGNDGFVFATLLAFTDTTREFALYRELESTEESLETTIEELQSANEELETTNEELQSTNEELETTNEELQSTNEELEATNEELRAAGEQMETVNDALRRQSDEYNAFRQHAEGTLRSIDAGIIVIDENFCVSSWNRWSEAAWGVPARAAIGRRLFELDIGLPVRQLDHACQRAVADGCSEELVVEARDREGRAMTCRVRIWPLLHDDRGTHGAVIMVEDQGR